MSTAPDLKEPRRIVDPAAYKQFHELQMRCLFCSERLGQAHHILPRARGGDDVLANFVPLCLICHGIVHGTPTMMRRFGEDAMRIEPEHVRRRIGLWLSSDDGLEARAYLFGKLGKGPAEAFMARTYGVRL